MKAIDASQRDVIRELVTVLTELCLRAYLHTLHAAFIPLFVSLSPTLPLGIT